MEELGQFLKERREEKGIALESISERTKIGMRYLSAIEKGDFNVIPGEIYLRGFLRKYASCVGLDPEVVIHRYEELYRIKEQHRIRSAARKEKRQEQRQKKRRILFLVLSIFVVACIIGAVVYYFLYLK